MSAVVSEPTRWRRAKEWFAVRFRSPAAIYGLIVFTTFVSLTDDDHTSSWDVLTTSLMTLIVFFIAHVFAHTLTEHGDHGLRRATRHAVEHAAGMLYASLPAILVLVYAGFAGITADDASDGVIVAASLVLGILGYAAYRRRGAGILLRLVGAVSTAMLGLFIVLLELVVH